jgi:hypothetical protein
MQARGDHSWWPFSHGSHACSLSSCCEAEMFFSLFSIFYLLLFNAFNPIWGAKVRIIFELTKKKPLFLRNLLFY